MKTQKNTENKGGEKKYKEEHKEEHKEDQIDDWFLYNYTARPWSLMLRRYQARSSTPCKKCSADDGGAASMLCARCEYYERQRRKNQ